MIGKICCSIVMIVLACSAAAATDIRRVVTALDANDKSIALFDSRQALDGGSSGSPSAILWATDSAPAGLSFRDDSAAKPPAALPPDSGTALLVVDFPPLDPATEAKMEPDLMMKVIGDRAPRRGLPVRHPLMHRTRTVDYAVVLSGEIDMMLDDSVMHIKAGDVVVQQATNHAWINHSGQPCRILFVLVDARQP
ncbi:MAG TPA: cupin domain-containing protein [Xanthobacteraceae bacterium]